MCVCVFFLFCHLFLQVAEEPAIILVVFAKAGAGYCFIAARCKVNLSFNLLGLKHVKTDFVPKTSGTNMQLICIYMYI